MIPDRLGRDGADLGRSFVPIGLLAVGAVVPPVRIIVLVAVVAAAGVLIVRTSALRWAWAAAVPVAVSLVWGTLPTPLAAVDGSDCANPASPVATWRALEAIVVIATLATLAVVVKASPATLALRWPERRWIVVAFVGFLATGPLALLVGPVLARPFFGDVGYVIVAGGLVPALLFAAGNGVMEELIYRGALLGWSVPVIGVRGAVVGQAVVFGLAHSGADVIGFQVPLMLTLGIGGLLAGIIAVRTRSLLLPIAIHIGFDIPIYFSFACGT